MKLTIVLPVYFEQDSIKKVLEQISQSVKTPHFTLVVYDTEKDPTASTVKNYIKENHDTTIKLVKNDVKTGKGVMNAIQTGFNKMKTEVVVVVMADLSDDISQIDKMYSLIEDGYDVVSASRYCKGGKKIGGPLLKTWMSKGAGLLLHHITGLPTSDATNAFKMYRSSVIRNIPIESNGGFEYSLELVTKAYKKGYKITEIPTIWRDRSEGTSNFKLFEWLPNYARWFFEAFKSSLKKRE